MTAKPVIGPHWTASLTDAVPPQETPNPRQEPSGVDFGALREEVAALRAELAETARGVVKMARERDEALAEAELVQSANAALVKDRDRLVGEVEEMGRRLDEARDEVVHPLAREVLELARKRDFTVLAEIASADAAARAAYLAWCEAGYLLTTRTEPGEVERLRADLALSEARNEHLAEGLRCAKRDLDDARAKVRLATTARDDVWFWQGDDRDDPESLCCPVVMTADTLRGILADLAAANEMVNDWRENALSLEQQLADLRASALKPGQLAMTKDDLDARFSHLDAARRDDERADGLRKSAIERRGFAYSGFVDSDGEEF